MSLHTVGGHPNRTQQCNETAVAVGTCCAEGIQVEAMTTLKIKLEHVHQKFPVVARTRPMQTTGPPMQTTEPPGVGIGILMGDGDSAAKPIHRYRYRLVAPHVQSVVFSNTLLPLDFPLVRAWPCQSSDGESSCQQWPPESAMCQCTNEHSMK